METNQKLPSTELWDDFLDIFLKPIHFKAWPGKVFITKVEGSLSRDNRPQLICSVNCEGGKFRWEVNKTNMKKLISLGLKAPKDLVNKNVYFDKVRVYNPSTKQNQDGLEVNKFQ